MNTRLRRQIEWHFKNYSADKRLYSDEVREIAESGITLDYSRVNVRSSSTMNLTDDKALLISERARQGSWARVVENVVTAFEFEIQGEIIQDKFDIGQRRGKQLSYYELVEKYGNGNRSVYDYRYGKIMERALLWAVKFDLIREKSHYAVNFRA